MLCVLCVVSFWCVCVWAHRHPVWSGVCVVSKVSVDLWCAGSPRSDYSFVCPVVMGTVTVSIAPARLPGMPAIWLADATGPASELRRQFFFTLIGAVAGATLSVVYYFWFRRAGCLPQLPWAGLSGHLLHSLLVLFHQHLRRSLIGTLFIVAGVVLAWWGRMVRPLAGAALAGLAFGLAVNSKQPLGIFALPALVLLVTADRTWKTRLGSAALLLGGLMLRGSGIFGIRTVQFPSRVHGGTCPAIP